MKFCSMFFGIYFVVYRVEQLEKQQSDNVDKFKHRAKELKATVSKELAEATLDAAGTDYLVHPP